MVLRKLFEKGYIYIFTSNNTIKQISDKAFCYPMYVYNDKVISVLQEMGYKVAFTGGDYKATRDNDKFKIPRYHIYDSTSLDEFIDMIN